MLRIFWRTLSTYHLSLQRIDEPYCHLLPRRIQRLQHAWYVGQMCHRISFWRMTLIDLLEIIRPTKFPSLCIQWKRKYCPHVCQCILWSFRSWAYQWWLWIQQFKFQFIPHLRSKWEKSGYIAHLGKDHIFFDIAKKLLIRPRSGSFRCVSLSIRDIFLEIFVS